MSNLVEPLDKLGTAKAKLEGVLDGTMKEPDESHALIHQGALMVLDDVAKELGEVLKILADVKNPA